MRWISEGEDLPKIGQRILLCSPRQHAEFWDMSVMCLMVDYDGVVPLPVKAGGEWPTRYFWGDPYYGRQHCKLITGNAWWSTFEGIELPPRALHRYMGPRNDHVIVQDGDVWVGRNELTKTG